MAKKKLSSDMIAFMRELILQEKTKVAQDSDIKSRPGTQPKKYHKGLSKSTKVARDAHFKKNDDYGDAPGDKGAKTKKSKHTKKFEKMFGENINEMPAGRSDNDTGKFNDLPKAMRDKMIARYGEPKFGGKHDFISNDGDTLFQAYEKNQETGSIGHKIIKLPSFQKLYSDWNDIIKDIKTLRKNPDVNSDAAARELFEEMKSMFRSLQRYLREERPEQYELMKMRRSMNEMAYEDIPCPACGDPNCDHKADHMNEEVVKQKLSQLDYKFLNSYFNAEKFSAPNPDDSLRSINNERDWNSWKDDTIDRFGDVQVELNKDAVWFDQFKIIDTKFMKDKENYIQAKGAALDKWRQTSNSGLDERLEKVTKKILNEKMDLNDPVMIKLRAAQFAKADRDKQAQLKKDVSKETRKQDKAKEIIRKLQVKKDQVLRRMENDPSVEPEGGEVADIYGDELNKIDNAIEKARLVFNQPMDYDTAVGKVNEENGELVTFGYDLDMIQQVVDYLKSKYKEGSDYELHIGRGDDLPNAVTLHSNLKKDPDLNDMLNAAQSDQDRYDAYTLDEYLSGDLEKRNEPLFDKLVPSNGDSKFVEGEMIRAMNRIVYRWYNDGDKFWQGYGTETAGPAHSFLVNSNEVPKDIQRTLEKLFDAVVGKYEDAVYEKMLNDLGEIIISYVEGVPEEDYKPLQQGMFNYDSEYQDEEEDEDDYYDDYEEEEDDYYQEGVLLEATKSIKDIKAGDVIVLGKDKHFEVDYIDPWSAGGRILVGKNVETGKKGKMKVKFLTPRAGDTGLADDTMLQVLNEGKEDEALKNKAEKANAPLGALRTIYNKGLAAFKSGHRPGANQHQWAMARVNSVLTGGPARKTDDAQWKQIQKFRKNKKKK